MSFKGFLESDHSPTLMSGQFESTFGSKVEFTLGSVYNHTFGTESKMFVDPLCMLPAESLIASLLLGCSGKVDFVFGSSTGVSYVGPKYEIKRSSQYFKFSDADFNTPEGSVLTSSWTLERADWKTWSVDVPVSTAVAALSVLMASIALALDLTLHLRYPAFGSEDKDDEETIDGYDMSPKIIKAISAILVSRIMAVIRMLEVRAQHTTNAVQLADDATADVVQASNITVVQNIVVLVANINLTLVEQDSSASIEEVSDALTVT